MVEIIRFQEFKLPPPSEKHFRRNTSLWFHEFEIEEVYKLTAPFVATLAELFKALPSDTVDKVITAPDFGELKLIAWRSVTPEVFHEELRYASLPGAIGTVTVML